jgi:hypothetical protein
VYQNAGRHHAAITWTKAQPNLGRRGVWRSFPAVSGDRKRKDGTLAVSTEMVTLGASGVGQTELYGGLCLPPQLVKVILTEHAVSRERSGITPSRGCNSRELPRFQASKPRRGLLTFLFHNPRELLPAKSTASAASQFQTEPC